MGFQEVKTLLNSGNITFKGELASEEDLREQISTQLEKEFGFPIPVLLRKGQDILKTIAQDPFKEIETHKDLRLYVTFLNNSLKERPLLPWVSQDRSFQIIGAEDKELYSILDVSRSKTTDAMNHLEKTYGKDITTRNWNTLTKIAGLLD